MSVTHTHTHTHTLELLSHSSISLCDIRDNIYQNLRSPRTNVGSLVSVIYQHRTERMKEKDERICTYKNVLTFQIHNILTNDIKKEYINASPQLKIHAYCSMNKLYVEEPLLKEFSVFGLIILRKVEKCLSSVFVSQITFLNPLTLFVVFFLFFFFCFFFLLGDYNCNLECKLVKLFFCLIGL